MSGSVTIAGLDSNSNYQPASAEGNVLALSTAGFRATYGYRVTDVTPAATCTDLVTLSGAAGKVVRVTRVTVSGNATAASLQDIYLIKRSAANTGGTATNPAATIYDNDAAASGVITLYSANPSGLGTGTNLDGSIIYLPAAATPAAAPTEWSRSFGINAAKCPTLRSATDLFAVNFNGNAIAAGAKVYVYIEWTEASA